MKVFMKFTTLFVFAFFLAACGGGGGDSVTVTPPPGTPPPVPGTFYSMEYNSSGTLILTFGKGEISFGLISPVNPADVDVVQWQSTGVNWENSTVTGFLMADADGIITAEIPGVPPNDPGNCVVKLKSGEVLVVWFNLGVWDLPANATFNAGAGQVSFSPPS